MNNEMLDILNQMIEQVTRNGDSFYLVVLPTSNPDYAEGLLAPTTSEPLLYSEAYRYADIVFEKEMTRDAINTLITSWGTDNGSE